MNKFAIILLLGVMLVSSVYGLSMLSVDMSPASIARIDKEMAGNLRPIYYTIKDYYAGKTYYEYVNFYSLNKTYVMRFDGVSDTYGIPVCTIPMNSTFYSNCIVDDRTSTHKVKVIFLEGWWVITDMQPPTTKVINPNIVVQGGSVKLAKEAVAGILNVNQSFQVNNLNVMFADIETKGTASAAIVWVLDAKKNVLAKNKIYPGTTVDIAAGGSILKVHLYQIAPGYTFGAKWADMAILSDEVELSNGQYVTVGKQKGDVILEWKNKGASGMDTLPDHLRKVIVTAAPSISPMPKYFTR